MVMYAPHTLLVRREVEVRDEFNRTTGRSYSFEKLGGCRCDDNTTQEVVDVNGNAYVPKYHIVSDKLDIRPGDWVRAMDGDEIRGEGEVKRVIRTNYLKYLSIYV